MRVLSLIKPALRIILALTCLLVFGIGLLILTHLIEHAFAGEVVSYSRWGDQYSNSAAAYYIAFLFWHLFSYLEFVLFPALFFGDMKLIRFNLGFYSRALFPSMLMELLLDLLDRLGLPGQYDSLYEWIALGLVLLWSLSIILAFRKNGFPQRNGYRILSGLAFLLYFLLLFLGYIVLTETLCYPVECSM